MSISSQMGCVVYDVISASFVHMYAITIYLFQTTFNSLYDWQCLLESLPSHQPTPYSLVSIGSSEVVGKLLPRLTTILEQIKSVGVLQAKLLCERVLDETKRKTEVCV